MRDIKDFVRDVQEVILSTPGYIALHNRRKWSEINDLPSFDITINLIKIGLTMRIIKGDGTYYPNPYNAWVYDNRAKGKLLEGWGASSFWGLFPGPMEGYEAVYPR